MRLIVLLLLPLSALAGEATLQCTLPTQNTDGTELTDLAEVRIYGSQQDGGPYNQQWPDTDTDCSEVITGLAPGTWYFVSTAVNSGGVESDYSNQATKVVANPIPNPPSNLTVLADNLTAYAISQTNDRLVLIPVGQVAESTDCDPSMQVNGRYLVPRDSVTWAATVRPAVVVAECGAG